MSAFHAKKLSKTGNVSSCFFFVFSSFCICFSFGRELVFVQLYILCFQHYSTK